MPRETFDVVNLKLADDGPPKPYQVITCHVCGEQARRNASSKRLPFSACAGQFRKQGWFVGTDSSEHTCPTCLGRTAHPLGQAVPKVTVDFTEDTPVNKTITLPIPRLSPKLSISELYILLGDAYDSDACTYKQGWNDKRVADESRWDLIEVIRRREQDFGPVRDTLVDDIVETLVTFKNDADKLADDCENIMQALEGLSARVSNLLTVIKGRRTI